MMKTLLAGACAVAMSLALGIGPDRAEAAEGVEIPARQWSFHGVFGHYDQAAMQRGFQVYKEVCAGCHGLDYIAFRNLADLGYNEDEIKAVAAEYSVMDGPDDEGEMFERPAVPSDYFPAPFANKKAAAAANGGAVPPDLSLITKARAGGADYIHALLTGYTEPEADFELTEGLNYNEYFPGRQIAMAAPLFDESVEYADGTAATLDQHASDVAVFLTWAADPKMETRKETGLAVILFLIIATGILYAVKRKVWADLH